MNTRHHTHFIAIWKEAPALRLLVPLIPGIVFQWYVQPPVVMLGIASIVASCIAAACFFSRYKTTKWMGASFYLLLFLIGSWLMLLKDQRRWQNHINQHYYIGETIIATLDEPLATKPKSYKADATVRLLDSAGNIKEVVGKITIYLQKDSTPPPLQYGSIIVFNQPLQPIKNLGNPGGFDFQRYAAFNGLYYQVYLKAGNYVVRDSLGYNPFKQVLFQTRDWVLGVFRKNIPGPVEQGMAEALLVGYKDDLDKNLVEQYASTGVVHIIAISGMHLGLIYGLLVVVFKPLHRYKWGKWASGLSVIAALWFFSLLTGGAPSITRAALMFSVIVLGRSFGKVSSIYNLLAISAILLLAYKPAYVWDVGFQLSYAALLSIVIFGQPITNWWHAPNRLLRYAWQLVAVTMAAQILTFPLSLYHFHQFPTYFLLANMVAVPLSSLILYGLIALLLFSWLPILAKLGGWLMGWAIFGMNAYIGWVNGLPGSTLDGLYLTIPMALAIALAISAMGWWLLRKSTNGLATALSFLLFFLVLWDWQFLETSRQRKLVVYNVPQKTAIDIMEGRSYTFLGDTALMRKDFLQNFHLLPSRIAHQAVFKQNLALSPNGFTTLQLGKEKLLVVDKPIDLKNSDTVRAGLLLVCNKMPTKPAKLLRLVKCHTIILDASHSKWAVAQWKNAADSLHLRLHSVQEQGAFTFEY